MEQKQDFENQMTQTPKRKHTEVLPHSEATNSSVGNMDIADLVGLMSNMLDEKLKHLATKNDLENVKHHIDEVKSDVNKISMENKELKEEVKSLKTNWESDQKRLSQLEDEVRKKKIIIRGLKTQKSAIDAVKAIYKDQLKISKAAEEIENVKKMYEHEGKMTVIVEMRTSEIVREVLKQSKELAGTSIFIDRDLSAERQQKKKIMIVLRKDILAVSENKRISVRGDKLVIAGKWFTWNRENKLMCGQKSGEEELRNIYGENSSKINIDYSKLILKVNPTNSKN